MGTRMTTIHKPSEAIHQIAKRHGVVSITVIGSVACGEEMPDTGTDVLVVFEQRASRLSPMSIQEDLEGLLGHSVDTVFAGGRKARDDHSRRQVSPVNYLRRLPCIQRNS